METLFQHLVGFSDIYSNLLHISYVVFAYMLK